MVADVDSGERHQLELFFTGIRGSVEMLARAVQGDRAAAVAFKALYDPAVREMCGLLYKGPRDAAVLRKLADVAWEHCLLTAECLLVMKHNYDVRRKLTIDRILQNRTVTSWKEIEKLAAEC